MIGKLLRFTDERGRRMLRRLLAAAALTAVLEGLAFALLIPVLQALFSPDPGTAGPWLLALGGLVLIYAGLFQLGTLAGYAYGTELLTTTHRRLGDRIALLPVGFFDADRTGELSQLAGRGAVFLASAPAHLVRPVIGGVLTPATVLVVLALVQWQLAVALLLAIPVLSAGFAITRRLIGRRDGAQDRTSAQAGARIVEFARQQPALRAFGRTGARSAGTPVVAALAEQHRVYRGFLWVGGGALALYGAVVQIVITAAIVVTAALALGGTVGVAQAAALLVLLVRFAEPLSQVGAMGSGIRVAENSLDRILALLAEPLTEEPADPNPPVPAERASVELRSVTFGYGDRPVLDGVSLVAPAGSMTAIVGPSGAGKSTVLRLISRFYDVTGGQVLLGGRDVRELGTAAVMGSVSQVFQQVYLFEGTLRDNVLLGRPDATEAELARVGRLARVDEIADRLPGGWDAQVGEGGSRLSGGEQQRVSIARALLKDAPIVLLDEATAALDPENEESVNDALAALAGRRTVLVVAHRLQTVMNADRIVVLDGRGGVAETGTHADLIERDGLYARFWAERSRAAGWRLVPSS